MRLTSFLAAVITLAFLVSGCGKSNEDLRAEQTLNMKVTAARFEAIKISKELYDVDGKLTLLLTRHDSLVAAHPTSFGEQNPDEVAKIKGRVSSAAGSFDTWNKAYRPYDSKAKHEAAMKKLTADQEDLTNALGNMEGALKAANGLIERLDKEFVTWQSKSGKRGRK